MKVIDYNSQPVCFAQVKLDGYRLTIDKMRQLTSATQRGGLSIWPKLMRVDRIREAVEKLPVHSSVMGELHADGVPATSIPTLINDGDQKLRFSVFAVPKIAGFPPLTLSWEPIEDRLEEWGFDYPETRLLHPASDPAPIDPEPLLAEARDRGIEGFVLKREHLDGWYKLKPFRTVDAVVMRVEQSFAATTFGGLKSIIVGVYVDGKLQEIANVGTGFDYEYRCEVDLQSLVGKIAEVSYDSIGSKGRLRFPRFVRWRDDKTETECVL